MYSIQFYKHQLQIFFAYDMKGRGWLWCALIKILIMDLSKSVLAGLEVVGSSAALKDDSFKKVVQLSLSNALDPGNRPRDESELTCFLDI